MYPRFSRYAQVETYNFWLNRVYSAFVYEEIFNHDAFRVTYLNSGDIDLSEYIHFVT